MGPERKLRLGYLPGRGCLRKDGPQTVQKEVADSSEGGSRNADRGYGDKVTDTWVSESSRETQ